MPRARTHRREIPKRRPASSTDQTSRSSCDQCESGISSSFLVLSRRSSCVRPSIVSVFGVPRTSSPSCVAPPGLPSGRRASASQLPGPLPERAPITPGQAFFLWARTRRAQNQPTCREDTAHQPTHPRTCVLHRGQSHRPSPGIPPSAARATITNRHTSHLRMAEMRATIRELSGCTPGCRYRARVMASKVMLTASIRQSEPLLRGSWQSTPWCR